MSTASYTLCTLKSGKVARTLVRRMKGEGHKVTLRTTATGRFSVVVHFPG